MLPPQSRRCAGCGVVLGAESTGDHCPACIRTEVQGGASANEVELARFLLDAAIRGEPTDEADDATGTAGNGGARPAATHETASWAEELSPTQTAPEATAGDRLPKGSVVQYFGDYEIRKVLGRGGMGVVYEARQMSLDRLVALKMIRGGLFADDDERRRFENEGHAVARLDHPGIVPVYEVGEHEGKKYFSMKLIEGENLAKLLPRYVGQPRLSAGLVADIADALHHAHVRGILHRDLKPANILIDGQGRAHVTDFGLARRIEGDPNLTASGAILGTPAYMSPEQAHGRRGSITTATDVYGIGTILYALITGRAPFGGDSAIETIEAVRTREPDRPRKLDAKIPRDLETICLKCLEKDQSRRYASAQELSADLRDWLATRPIRARRVAAPARFGLWCRRNPVIAGLSAALIVAVLGGGAGIVRNWLEVREKRDQLAVANARISRERDISNAINDLLVNGLLTGANPHGKNLTVVELLDRVAGSVGQSYRDKGRPDLEAAAQRVVGDAYRAQGKLDLAARYLERASNIKESNKITDEEENYATCHSLAALRMDQGRLEDARALGLRALDGRSSLLGLAHPATLDSAILAAMILKSRGETAEARRRLELCREASASGVPDLTRLRLESALATILLETGELDRAESHFLGSIEFKTAILPRDHIDLLNDKNSLASIHFRKRRFAEAAQLWEPVYRTAKGMMAEEHPFVVCVRSNLLAAYIALGEMQKASPLMGLGVGTVPNYQSIAALNNQAVALMGFGRYAEAEATFRAVVQWYQTNRPGQDELAACVYNLGVTQVHLKKSVEAEDSLKQALHIFERTRPEDQATTDCRATLGWMLVKNAKHREARPQLEQAVAGRSAQLNGSAWRLEVTRSLLGEAILADREFEVAESILLDSYRRLLKCKDAPAERIRDARARIVLLYAGWPGHEEQVKYWTETAPAED